MVNERRIISIDSDDRLYLERLGINRSKFVRQAIQAHRDGKFKYVFVEE